MPNKIDKYILVEIRFQQKTSPYSNVTYYFSDRYIEQGKLYLNSPEYYPLLISVSGLGSELGEVLPKNKTGSIVLSNARGTIQHDFRVGDFLASHSVIDKVVRVRTFEKKLGVPGSSGDLVLEFNGFCSGVSINHSNDTISFDTYENYGGTDLLNAVVTEEAYDDINPAAVARPMNVLFGSGVESVGLLVDKATDAYSYGYGSTIGTQYINSGVTRVLAKDKSTGLFGEVSSVTSVSDPEVDGMGITGNYDTMYLDILEGVEYAYRVNVSGGRIITGGRFYVLSTDDHPPSNAEFVGNKFNFAMYGNLAGYTEPDQKNKKSSCSVLAADFELAYTGDFGPVVPNPRTVWRLDFVFDEAFVLHDGVTGYFSWSQELGDATEFLFPISNTDDTRQLWVIPGSTDPGEDRTFTFEGSEDVVHWLLWGVEIEDLSTNLASLDVDAATNRGISRIRLLPAITTYGQTVETLDKLELIIVADGLKDDTSGTITGTPGELLDTTEYVVKFLNSQMNSRAVVTNQYDFDHITASSAVSGSFDSLTTVKDAISEILFNGSAKLVPLRSGNLAYYRYGARKLSYIFASEEDARLLNLKIGDKADIINSGHVFYNRSKQPLTIEELQEGSKNYASGLTLTPSNTAGLANSSALYGRRYLDDRGTFLNFLSTNEQARFFLDCIFRQWAMESWTVQFLLPYWAQDYKSIEVNSIVRFRHQKNLHAGGSESSVTATPPTSGTAYNFGQVWVRAKTYPFRILSRAVEYTEAGGEPYLKFSAKVLNNERELY